MGRGCAINLANVFLVMLLVLAVGASIVAVVAFSNPDFLPRLLQLRGADVAVAMPTRLTLAQLPPTPTVPTATLPPLAVDLEPTWTPSSGEVVAIPGQPTNTRRPTLTPSVTATFPPPTPSRTPTPTPTETPSPGPPPTVTNTRSPYPFTKTTDSPQYLRNFANTAGCDWLGIGGVVYDIAANPVAPGTYQVHVWGPGPIDQRVRAGAAPAYGPSGWEVFIHNQPAVRLYNIQLESASGTAVSQVYQVQTRASCNENLVYFIFIQNYQ